MVIDNEFNTKQVVYLLTDEDQRPRIVTAIKICADGGLLYELAYGTLQSVHYAAEISTEKNILATL